MLAFSHMTATVGLQIVMSSWSVLNMIGYKSCFEFESVVKYLRLYRKKGLLS